MNNSYKAILLGLIGVVAAVFSGIYVAKPNYEEVQNINAEIVQLQNRLAELNAKQADREKYIADTEKYNADFEEYLNAFPADLNQEITIMFLDGIKTNNEFSLESLAMGQKEQFYTLGQGGGDAALEAPAEATDTEEEGEPSADATEASTAESTLEEGAYVDNSSYNCFRAVFPITYYGSYNSLKDVINYVAGYSDRMTINSLEIGYDVSNDLYSGNLELYCYSVECDDRPERQIELNEVEIGVDNIFSTSLIGGGSSAGSANNLNKYDENDGAAIESNYDFYAMLNASTSDMSAKIVGQNGTGKEASVISNSDNSVSTLVFELYESNGKNYCKYTLDDSTSYEAEVTSAEDVKILLQSSARKNDDDKAGIRVTIRNSTNLPVYVKVTGDDGVSPRVNIAGQTGSVKVYK